MKFLWSNWEHTIKLDDDIIYYSNLLNSIYFLVNFCCVNYYDIL